MGLGVSAFEPETRSFISLSMYWFLYTFSLHWVLFCLWKCLLDQGISNIAVSKSQLETVKRRVWFSWFGWAWDSGFPTSAPWCGRSWSVLHTCRSNTVERASSSCSWASPVQLTCGQAHGPQTCACIRITWRVCETLTATLPQVSTYHPILFSHNTSSKIQLSPFYRWKSLRLGEVQWSAHGPTAHELEGVERGCKP